MARETKDSGIEWIGEIPADWNISKTKLALQEVQVKNDPVKTDCILSLVKDKGVIPYEEKGDVGNKAKDDISEYKIAFPNTIVLNSMNILIGSIGISDRIGCVSPVYYVFKEKSNWDLKFIYYLMTTRLFQQELRKFAKGILEIRLRVSVSDILKRSIPHPSFCKQKAIASFLDSKCAEIDKAIEDTKASIEEYKNLRQAIITEAVTKGLDSDVEMKDSCTGYLGTIPSKWRVKKLRFLGSCQNGISKGAEFFGEKGYPFVSYSDVYKNIILPIPSETIDSTQKERALYSVEKGDIFFTRTSETIEEIGFSSVCLETIPNATFAGFLIRVRPINKELNEKYSSYYFRSDIHRRYFTKEMNLVTRASLGQTLLKNMPILIPAMDEQQRISDYLDTKCSEIDSLIKSKEKLIEELTAYRKSLIYEYVTGKKEVPTV